jgi:hypothetical protein
MREYKKNTSEEILQIKYYDTIHVYIKQFYHLA